MSGEVQRVADGMDLDLENGGRKAAELEGCSGASGAVVRLQLMMDLIDCRALTSPKTHVAKGPGSRIQGINAGTVQYLRPVEVVSGDSPAVSPLANQIQIGQ